MARRVTIMIDDEIIRKLHAEQAKIIQKTNSSVSLSRIINQKLGKTLR